MTPIAISVSDTCEACGIGRTTLYKLLNEGVLESKLIGRKRVILVSSIENYFATLEKT